MIHSLAFLALVIVASAVFAVSVTRLYRVMALGRVNDLRPADRLGDRIAREHQPVMQAEGAGGGREPAEFDHAGEYFHLAGAVDVLSGHCDFISQILLRMGV